MEHSGAAGGALVSATVSQLRGRLQAQEQQCRPHGRHCRKWCKRALPIAPDRHEPELWIALSATARSRATAPAPCGGA